MTCLEVRELLPELAVDVLPRRPHRGRAASPVVRRVPQGGLGPRPGGRDLAFSLPGARPAGTRRRASWTASGGSPAASAPPPRENRGGRDRRRDGRGGEPRLGRGHGGSRRPVRGPSGAGATRSGRALERFRVVLSQVIPGEEVSSNEGRGSVSSRPPPGAPAAGRPAARLAHDARLRDRDRERPERRRRTVSRTACSCRTPRVEVLRAGRIAELDSDGGAEVFRQFQTQPSPASRRSRWSTLRGEVVLTGTVDQDPDRSRRSQLEILGEVPVKSIVPALSTPGMPENSIAMSNVP